MLTKKQSFLSECANLCNLPTFVWHDDGWLQYRQQHADQIAVQPLNVYQVQIDGWKCGQDGKRCADTASELACYAKQMGYTHVELLPTVLSHKESMTLADIMHEAGIGIVFAVKRQDNEDAVSAVARYVFGYHADGLCLEQDGETSKQVADFLHSACPEVFIISRSPVKDVTCFCCDPTWNEGTFTCLGSEAPLRKFCPNKGMKTSGEGRMLSVSHKDAERDGRSLLDNVSGDYWEKFAGVRALVGHMITAPGKKRMFMGCEIGEFRKWEAGGTVEWFLLDHEAHAKLQLFFAHINQFYLSHPALWNDGEGCTLVSQDRERCVVCYSRSDGDEYLLAVVNFSAEEYEQYELCIPRDGVYDELINSDRPEFGGRGVINSAPVATEYSPRGNIFRIAVPPLAACIFRLRKGGRASEDTQS